jgi:hypothetical protein
MKRISAGLVALATVVLVGAGPVAAETKPTSHCVQHVVDKLKSGELVLSEPECYDSFSEAMSAEGVDAWGDNAYARVQGLAAATFVIGTHWDGGSFSGDSASVIGEDCDGGWLNVSAQWNNRISSTSHGCPRIKHFNGGHMGGISQTTLSPGGNLTTLNNMTSSIQYLT